MEKTRVMVVEDESIVAMDIKMSLQNMGYDVPAIVSSGNNAIEQARKIRPDLVLMDIVLRGTLNGIDAAGRIRSHLNIPVIYLTAYADEKILEQAKITEPAGYIIKPFHDKELHSIIKMALYKHSMEKKLRESQVWFSTVLNSIGDALIATDAGGRIKFMNPVAESLLGVKQEEVSCKASGEVLTIVHEATGEKEENPIERVLKYGTAVNLSSDNILLTRDGARIPIDDSGAPIRDTEGNVIGAVLVFHDITARKNAEMELKEHRDNLQDLVKRRTAELVTTNRELEKEIDAHKLAREKKNQLFKKVESVNQELKDFVYIVSHDLKSPLRAVSTLANWIVADYADRLDDEGRDQLKLLVERVKKMHAMIDGILKYSRVEHAREKKDSADMNELVSEAIELVMPPENIRVIVENKLPSILCERTGITEVLQNLLGNAVRYIDKPDGIIRIGCTDENGFWKFSISDNGKGIEEKHFDRIFQIFQTLSSGKEEESTGLGLTIVKKIVTNHGGKVWVKSQLGQGSTFFFTLPKG
jgi:PAS domain S-box-containing protein